MKVISIEGKSNSGKSMVIRYVIINLIKNRDFDVRYNSKRYANDAEVLSKRIAKEHVTQKGFVSQITCAGYLDGKKICITTYGDSYRYDIVPAIEKGKQILGDIDLFICASHGTGTDSLKQIADVQIIKKERFDENEREERDKLFSNEVVERILDY